ncbi:MAG: type 4a pilus biogenesis protein PilO [Actinobacteria bacterium]|nr:type 4a pilus biogenesis protein PilO [Actinomycetota bacterium]
MNFKIGKPEAFILAILILVISSVAFWFIGYQPAKREIDSIVQQQNEIIKKIEENKLTLQRLSELKQEAAKMEASLVNILSNLPTKPELPSYLIMVNEVADKSGVKILNFKPASPAQESQYVKIPVDLSISSKFNDVKELGGSLVEFLYLLENLPRITKVESINIVRSESTSSLNVTLKLSTYSLVGLQNQSISQTQQTTQTTTQTAQQQAQGQ